MSAPIILPQSFYSQPALQVARQLIGKHLTRIIAGQPVGGIISETEAYSGEDDLACHARSGKTPRTAIMYGPPGKAYVYFNYGIHWLLNCVTDHEGFPAAVLIRAIIPDQGLHIIKNHRAGKKPPQWCNGPAKLCQALDIDGSFNNYDLCPSSPEKALLFIESRNAISNEWVSSGPRVGINNVPEPWRSIPWRFQLIKEYLNQNSLIS